MKGHTQRSAWASSGVRGAPAGFFFKSYFYPFEWVGASLIRGGIFIEGKVWPGLYQAASVPQS